MKAILFTVAACIVMTACTAPTTNTSMSNSNANSNASANSNTNSGKSTATAPTADTLLAMDKEATDAYTKHNGQFFDTFLNDQSIILGGNGVADRATTVRMINEDKCVIKDEFKLDNPKMKMVGSDVAILVYHAHGEGSCPEPGGKTITLPPDVEAATIYVKKGDKWLGAFHSETPVASASHTAPSSNSSADKTNAAPSSNTSSQSTSKPAANPNTDALMAVERSGWEAWKAGDVDKLKAMTSPDVSIIDPAGVYQATQADTLKSWTEPKCEVKSFDLTDAQSISLTPDVSILAFKAAPAGTCGSEKLGPMWSASVYQKTGDAWKMVFGTSVPAM